VSVIAPEDPTHGKSSAVTTGLAIVLTGAFGIMLLLVATANPLGLSAVAGVYWPGTVVALILTLFSIGAIEGGLAVMGQPRGVMTIVLALTSIAVGFTLASPWLRIGIEPSSETYVVGATFALYAVLRVVLTLSGMRGQELARAVGVEPAVPDPGETRDRFALRMILGFLVGIPLLDSLIVLVGVALAPNDRRIYPTPSDTTLLAALLWLVGLAAVSSGTSAFLRGRAGTRRLLAHALVAVTALVPAFALDARVPLYPFVAGILAQAAR
jgi:hypothetical protein